MHKVDAMLANATTFYKLPGLVAVVSLGKAKAWFKGYGKRDARVDDSPPPSVRPLQARLLAAPLPHESTPTPQAANSRFSPARGGKNCQHAES